MRSRQGIETAARPGPVARATSSEVGCTSVRIRVHDIERTRLADLKPFDLVMRKRAQQVERRVARGEADWEAALTA